MKKLLFLLLLPFMAVAQVSNGQEQEFDYGIKNNSSQQILTPDTLVTRGTDGTYGHTAATSLPVSTATQDSIDTKIASNAGLQNAYNFEPEIITSAIKGAVTVQEGTGNDANNVLTVQNGTGTTTFSVSGAGNITATNMSTAPLKTTISAIRLMSGTLFNNYFYTTDSGKEGSWYYDATDTTSIDNTGTILVTSDGKRIKRIFKDYVFPEWFGAVGDGVTNDSFAMESANNTGYDIFLQSGKSYLTPGFTPRSNINVLGKGKAIVSAIEGGFKQTNFYNDISQRISFGDEYLNYWLGKVPTGTSKIIFSGDSTTAGATLAGNEALPYIFNRLLTYDGIEGVTVINSGQSGENTEDWNTTYLASDMSQNPDLYIIRWGINDSSRGVLAFNASLREGLQKIREVYSKDLTNISIVLMTPNSISNSSNDNDEEWVKSIIPYIRQAARDYNCTYIDTYSLLSDSRSGKDIYFDNIGVHPKFQYNNLIASYIYDKIIPTNIRILGSSSKVWNESTSTRIATVSDAPNSYKKGISINRTDLSFPYDGFTITSKPLGSGAGTVQVVYSYASSSDYASRTSLNGSVWNAWVYSSMNAKYNNLLLGDITATRITNLDVLDSNKLTASNGNATIRSTDTAAIDKGGYLTLGGSYNGTLRTVFAGIAGRKENAINNNIAGYLSFVTSDATLGLTEKMRLFSNGGLNLGGTTNPGAGIIQATSYTGGATLTGTPTAPTAPAGTNTTQIATTAYVDSAVSAAAEPYLVYTAILNQSGTSAPTATVLRNTLGGTVVWTRNSAGVYLGTLSGAFNNSKTVCFVTGGSNVGTMYATPSVSTDSVQVVKRDEPTNTGTDDLSGVSFEIRVYP